MACLVFLPLLLPAVYQHSFLLCHDQNTNLETRGRLCDININTCKE